MNTIAGAPGPAHFILDPVAQGDLVNKRNTLPCPTSFLFS